MAFDAFLKIEGIPGESVDRFHKDEIEISSFSWGLSQSGGSTGSGGGAGKVSMQDINFTKHIDKSSPLLLRSCATGEHIKKAVLTVRKAGGNQQEFLVIKLQDCLVSSYSTGGSEGDDVNDQLSLNFTKIEFVYTPPKGDAVTSGELDSGQTT